MKDVTLILEAINRGESGASEKLLPLVYDELRWIAAARMMQESAGHTLQATALWAHRRSGEGLGTAAQCGAPSD